MKRHYPPAPVVGVSGVVISDERVLLIKRGAEPAKGIWSLPGGAVELGERLEEACRREILEETGLDVTVGPLVEVVERLHRDSLNKVEYHYILLDYLCTTRMNEPRAASDAADARWSAVDDLSWADLTEDTAQVIKKAAALAREIRKRPV